MSKCSPRYIRNGEVLNMERMEGPTQCDHQCPHWHACWEELRGGSSRVMPLKSKTEVEGKDHKRVFNTKRV